MTTATMSEALDSTTGSAADLLLKMNNSDRTAWDEAIRRYGKLVSATVRSFRLQEADTFDAIQSTWLRLVENAEQVRFPERLGGWLATTARRECLHILRRAKREPRYADVLLETVSDPSAGPENRAIDADTSRKLRKLIDELSPRRRILLRMLFSDNPCSYDEVARIAGIPSGGIGPTRARALQQLRDRIDRHEM